MKSCIKRGCGVTVSGREEEPSMTLVFLQWTNHRRGRWGDRASAQWGWSVHISTNPATLLYCYTTKVHYNLALCVCWCVQNGRRWLCLTTWQDPRRSFPSSRESLSSFTAKPLLIGGEERWEGLRASSLTSTSVCWKGEWHFYVT